MLRYTLSPAALRSLLDVEAARAVVDHTPVPPGAAEELRRRARLRSTHYSTRIEGNRLTLEEQLALLFRDQAPPPPKRRRGLFGRLRRHDRI